MEGFEPSLYGDRVADVYDLIYEGRASLDLDASVEFLRALAGEGPVLELGVGTGRVAIPLAARGIEVHGIDVSERMLERLRAKPGGERVRASLGDMAAVDVEAKFRLVFAVLSSFFGLTTQQDQQRCLRNVAERLTGDGALVLEAFVPDASRFRRGQNVEVGRIEPDYVLLVATQHDALRQTLTGAQILIREEGTRLIPAVLRYAYPTELDLMAEAAGLRLRERWANWRRAPFTASSGLHVSVYERA